MRGPLFGALFPLALALGVAAAPGPVVTLGGPQQIVPRAGAADDDPRAVVRAATHAVRSDSASPLRAHWTSRLRANSADRAAALGLATLARLTYDYADADQRYRRLFEGAPADDRYAVYARLGLARGQEARGRMRGLEELLRAARASARSLGDSAAEAEALLWLAHSLAPVHGGAFALAHVDSSMRVLPAAEGELRATVARRRASGRRSWRSAIRWSRSRSACRRRRGVGGFPPSSSARPRWRCWSAFTECGRGGGARVRRAEGRRRRRRGPTSGTPSPASGVRCRSA